MLRIHHLLEYSVSAIEEPQSLEVLDENGVEKCEFSLYLLKLISILDLGRNIYLIAITN